MRHVELSLLVVALGLGSQRTEAQPEAPLAVTHAVVIDGTGGAPLEGATLVIRGDRIEAVGRDVSVPAGARVIDASGRTVMPGLADMHVHLLGGWDGEGEPPVDQLVARAADAGFVDDAAFALSKARSLTARGYGSRRVRQALLAAGIEEADGEAAREHAREDAVEAALHFARRRRIGPFAAATPGPKAKEKALAAMVRAGHDFHLSKVIIGLDPGVEFDPQDLESTR